MEQRDATKALAGELSDVRRRGLANIDLNTPGQPRLALSRLEALARDHADDPTGRRIELIRRLLLDNLQAYSEQGFQLEAQLIRRLFFDGPNGTIGRQQPGELLKIARQASGLGEATFAKRRSAIFRDFAAYLITGSPVQQNESEEPPVVEPAAEVAGDPSESAAAPAGGQPSAAMAEPVAAIAAVFIEAREPLPPASVPKPPAHRLSAWGIVLALVAIVVVTIAGGSWWFGRSHGGSPPATGTHTSSGTQGLSTAATTAGSSQSGTTTAATLTMDDLGGGSSTIHVFPGIQDTPQDKIPNGTYRNGEKVPPLCKAEGRLVTSDTTVGERPRQSDVWIQIGGTPGLRQYAPLTYASVSGVAVERLPPCTGT